MKVLPVIAVLLSAFIATSSFAKGKMGAGSSGGGDLCEARIKIIREDLKDWINKGGPNGLKLSSSTSVGQYTYGMLDQIERAKITCVSSGDRGYPVNINGTAKVCRFDRKQNDDQITCDFNKFQSMSESDQYVLIHHEFAGLAGLEIPTGADSNYSISNQMSGYLVNKVVKKLSIKPNNECEVSEDGQSNCQEQYWSCSVTGVKYVMYLPFRNTHSNTPSTITVDGVGRMSTLKKLSNACYSGKDTNGDLINTQSCIEAIRAGKAVCKPLY